jgi:predicted metalloprotease
MIFTRDFHLQLSEWARSAFASVYVISTEVGLHTKASLLT